MRERSVGSATAFFDIVGAPPPPPEPMPPIPVYALNLEDDLPYDSPEFVEGLAAVLDKDPEKNIFQAKRSAPVSSSLRLARCCRWGKDATSAPSTRRVPPAGLCVLAKDNGHVMLGKDYIKTVERGVEVSRTELPTEKEWREALEANFGITL